MELLILYEGKTGNDCSTVIGASSLVRRQRDRTMASPAQALYQPFRLQDRFDTPSHRDSQRHEADRNARQPPKHVATRTMQTTHVVLAVCLNLSTPQLGGGNVEEAFFNPASRHHERAMYKVMSSESE